MWSNRRKVGGVKTKSVHKDGNEKNLGFSHRAGLRHSRGLRLLFSWAAKRKRIIVYSIGVIIALFAVLSPTIFYRLPTTSLHAAGRTVTLEIASTPATRQKGLSGRKTMAADHGMLFVFQQPSTDCFWMKGMYFPLDMVWLNDAKQVLHVQADATPQSYPKQFCPGQPARYVIEINAGQAARLGIQDGKSLSF